MDLETLPLYLLGIVKNEKGAEQKVLDFFACNVYTSERSERVGTSAELE